MNPTVLLPDILVPDIFADLDFEFDEDATFVSVQERTSSFPSFSIFVTRQDRATIPIYDSGAPYRNTALLLFWPKPISTTVKIKEPRGCVAIGDERPTCEK